MQHNLDGWLAVGLFFLGGLFSVLAWLFGKKLDQYDQQHADHYRHAKEDQIHFRDFNVHWTPRERDELAKKLDDMSDNLKELLRRNGGYHGDH